MATATWPMPTPETCDVVENVASYAGSEFDDGVLIPLKKLSEDAAASGFVDFELEQAGLPQPEGNRPLTDEEAGRIWRCVENVAQTARWLTESTEEARDLLLCLTEPEQHRDLTDEEYSAYKLRMRDWFAERVEHYSRGDDDA